MLGHKLIQTMAPNFDTWATVRGSFDDVAYTSIFDRDRTVERTDVRDYDSLEAKIASISPDVVINAVGVTKQVPAYKDPAELITINSILPHKLAELGAKYGYRLILISTDCVFSGRSGNYNEAHPADATDLYGRSKLLGEVAEKNCLTIRTSIIGRELMSSNSLTEWFLSRPKGEVPGFSRAIYTGFPTVVFSEIVADILIDHPNLNGVVHISSDPISKYDLLIAMNSEFGVGHKIASDDRIAVDRSLDSSRFRELTGFRPMPWHEMVHRMVSDPTPYPDIRNRKGHEGPRAEIRSNVVTNA